MNRLNFALCCVVLLAGCGGPQVDNGAPSPQPTTTTPVAAPQPTAPTVPADAYASIDAGLQAYIKAAEASDKEERSRSGQWLVMQGAKAIQPVAAAMNNSESGIRSQIGLCRLLGKLGSGAADPLMAAAGSHPQRLVRVNATGQLSVVKPPTKAIVDKLLELVSDEDDEIRRSAINGLGRLGAKAARAKDKLLSILNNTKESETIRAAAKSALTKVDARHSFVD